MVALDVPGRVKPDLVENIRIVGSRGKQESALLIILMGTAATPIATNIGFTYRPEIIENIRLVTSNRGKPLISILSFYPADVISGFDNFEGWPPPEPPFIQNLYNKALVPILQSYASYNPIPDITLNIKSKREFLQEPDFIKAQGNYLLTALVIKPPPVGDLTTFYRVKPVFEDRPFDDKTNKGAWHIVMMPQLAPAPVTPAPRSGLPFYIRSGMIVMTMRTTDWYQE